ncbi:RimJ/RimL family protein N-acetyltransferase [Clostridium acetobutylicum]|uniref:Predicted acetyltransferase n=1 Tax=Clostridium acetobutylicum (strain ATCC 824 / DSM 792 / JCM 1419 / IAM 19013 / LMG 5710 / NBRC 13948 / NRRL B-527 / VKM B-1787 / 2291 / W) TaxID=272562 RepID=Q97J70_CLOAB|nr:MULTISPECIES: GNAT family N-acetyltransferase [Clostridium]AAK79384.1 Predicted acetyltransferase [Clostridium acetobutylicum ATCC 824]ADZ20469.1 acetyltransferase [Clostridium acetobutylicum EA 2018]AEI34348.1 acetyltransferase [Clostridium acetobutylicum DSM 1731]AWV81367.1 N-acetyltransferase [Clostridium acetobutylicum]MBC2393001.1 GNAT family N-acetyltransferase [Clostridium acetobutylicum]
MDKEIIVREVLKEDDLGMIEYLKKIAEESNFLTFGKGEVKKSVLEEREFIENAIKNKTSLFIVAESEGKIIGNLNFSTGENSRVRHTGEFGVSVLKEYWGLGVGRKLIMNLIAWSKKNHIVRKINLRVRTDNYRAIKLYESLGFVNEGTIKRDFLIDGEFYDSFSMGLCID